MPPKARFAKEEIVMTALEITRTEGIRAVTARAVGKKLGSSSSPIFTVFQSMEEVQEEVAAAAREIYDQYVQKGLTKSKSFKSVGIQYIRFANDEPKLFQLLFMFEQPSVPGFVSILPLLEENYKGICSSAKKDFGLNELHAENLYRHLWIYTHGIATLCATKVCRFSESEIDQMMSEVCDSLVMTWKGK